MLRGELRNSLRLSLLRGLATAAALEQKITGSDKAIWLGGSTPAMARVRIVSLDSTGFAGLLLFETKPNVFVNGSRATVYGLRETNHLRGALAMWRELSS